MYFLVEYNYFLPVPDLVVGNSSFLLQHAESSTMPSHFPDFSLIAVSSHGC